MNIVMKKKFWSWILNCLMWLMRNIVIQYFGMVEYSVISDCVFEILKIFCMVDMELFEGS